MQNSTPKYIQCVNVWGEQQYDHHPDLVGPAREREREGEREGERENVEIFGFDKGLCFFCFTFHTMLSNILVRGRERENISLPSSTIQFVNAQHTMIPIPTTHRYTHIVHTHLEREIVNQIKELMIWQAGLINVILIFHIIHTRKYIKCNDPS
eukprot:sb/3473339/